MSTNSINTLPKIHIIVGATASGKSAYALSLAQKMNAVIINADSQQVYSDLNILTARPTPEEEALIPHKLYGTIGATEHYSAGIWLRYAKMEIDWARTTGITPIIVGGTGLYIKSLTHGISDIPNIDPTVRAQSMNDYEQMGKEAFISRLRTIDPIFFERLKVYDRQRLTRAYEVWLGTAKTLSWWQSRETSPAYPPEDINITNIELPREKLYQRCNERFINMLKNGAIDEVKELMQLHLPEHLPIMKTIGIREISSYLRNEATLDETIEKCQTATRQYAKRQITWFKNQL